MGSQFKRGVRAVVAGSLVFGGALTAVVIGGAIPASAATVVQTIQLEPLAGLQSVSSDGTHVWVTQTEENTVTELSASTGSVVQTITVGNRPTGVSSDGTFVWVANSGDNTVTALNASNPSGAQTTVSVGHQPAGISSDGINKWVAN
jgi:YVTN family beta-propeller protein